MGADIEQMGLKSRKRDQPTLIENRNGNMHVRRMRRAVIWMIMEDDVALVDRVTQLLFDPPTKALHVARHRAGVHGRALTFADLTAEMVDDTGSKVLRLLG